MANINFYHLTTTPLGKALPKLLEKVLENNLKAQVLSVTKEQVKQLNKELWTYTTKVFLPHGSVDEDFPEQQPIYLTDKASDNPNNATILAITFNAEHGNLDNFAKVMYLFDGQDEVQLANARSKWKEFSTISNHQLIYWKQDKKGVWSKD